MNKYLNILQQNNLSTCNDMIKILSESMWEVNLENYTFKEKNLIGSIIENKIKRYSKVNNKKIKVFYSGLNQEYILIGFEFKLKDLKVMVSYQISEKTKIDYNGFSLSYNKTELSLRKTGIDWFFMNRKYFSYLKLFEEETTFKIVMIRKNKNNYLSKVGFDELLSQDFNKYPEEVGDFLLLKKDFTLDFIEKCLIVDDYSLSLDKEKLSRISLDINSIKF